MRPLTARLAGAGSVIVLALGVTAATAPQRVEAQAPLCFTTWGGDCYCFDFFFTKVKEQVISQGQQYINNLMGEHNTLMKGGVQEALGQQVGNVYTYRGYLDDVQRESLNQLAHERSQPSGTAIPEGTRAAMRRDPEGDTVLGRQARAIATANAEPEELAPYRVSRQGGAGTSAEQVQDWADRMVLEPGPPNIPDDEGISQLGMRDLLEAYEDARHFLGATYARHHLKELAASEERLKALNESRERIDVGHLDQPGANHAAGIVAKTVSMAIETEILESQLRKESLTAALVAMRVGGAHESE